MRCPFCKSPKDKVIDSRSTANGFVIRRRRQCRGCNRRYTTYERVEETPLQVVKKDGRREAFSREKIVTGIRMACRKRPISTTKIEEFVDGLELYFQEMGKKEVDSSEVGERVINKLKEWDEVAYVRFASVYRHFRDISQFMAELESILKSRSEEETP